jgi:fructose transport system ATP-binding protein
LIKVISGVETPDAGAVWVEGEPMELGSVPAARSLGIETVYQDRAVVNTFTSVENIYLGREVVRWRFLPLVDKKKMRRDAKELVSGLNASVAPMLGRRLKPLSSGQRQAVALSRCAAWGTRVVIVDEPTAALGVQESQKALELVRALRSRGVSTLIVSHNLEHMFSVCDRITVMRRGRVVGIYNTRESSAQRALA